MTSPAHPPAPRLRRALWWVVAGVLLVAVGVAVAVRVTDEPTAAEATGPRGTTGTAPSPASTPVPRPTSTTAPAPVCGSASLRGPARPPAGAVVVETSDDLAALTEARPAGTTFWLAPGTHRLRSGQYEQVRPKAGNRYVGAPGAVLDGGTTNRYAFGGDARDVVIEALTVQRFGAPGENNNEGVVNHDGATGWRMTRLTVRQNAGAGILLGDGNRVEGSCLTDNGQYGFSAYSPDGVEDVVVRGNEIARNNTDDWERRIEGCGCTGGGKFWETVGALVQANSIHDNLGTGLWADTNNAGFTVTGNHFADNAGPAIIYETSYNAAITRNTFVRNGLRDWRTNPGFPTGAVYVSESGSDPRVDTAHSQTFEVAENLFVDNWGGVVAWENADRFAGSPANTSTGASTLVNPRATVARCSDPKTVGTDPYLRDCRWSTQHLRVHDNTFRLSPAALGPDCTAANLCGFSALMSNYGTFPDWSPYKGTVVEEWITTQQDNLWSDNTYTGPWRFMAREQGNEVSWEEWRAAPYSQDRGSTLSG